MLNLIMEEQAKGQQEMNVKLVEMQAQINRITSRLDCLESQMTQVTSNVKSLNSQVARLASSSQRTMGTLPVSYAMEPPNGFCGAIIQGEATIELKETTKVETTPLLAMNVLEVEKKIENEVPLVKNASSQGVEAKPEFEAKVVRVRKGTKKKKLKKAQCDLHESHPPSITLQPLKIIDGKLECNVKCKGHSKPFTKARIILAPASTTKGDLGMVTPKMAVLFGLKLGDRGPLQDDPPPTTV